MRAPSHLARPVLDFARTDFPRLHAGMSVDEALGVIRDQGVGERLIYFYVVDADERLAGVLPTRRLLGAQPDATLGDLMIRRVVALPAAATLLDACDLFVLHKFFALPVIDADRRVVGVIDVGVLTEEMLEFDQDAPSDTVFELLGFHVEQTRGATAWTAFRVRFPWLLATIASGTCAALLAGAFEATLTRVIALALFVPLVLALAEAVSIQSMTITIQTLRGSRPTLRWLIGAARRELLPGVLIGLASGLTVAAIAWLWRGQQDVALVVGASICGGIVIACGSGVGVPAALHALKLDPKIAAGPITLALADLLTLLLYFSLAAWLL